jgi:hypothetical protein
MWVRSGREYGLCSTASLWLGQCIAFCRRGIKAQRKIFCSTLPIQFSEEPSISGLETCKLFLKALRLFGSSLFLYGQPKDIDVQFLTTISL